MASSLTIHVGAPPQSSEKKSARMYCAHVIAMMAWDPGLTTNSVTNWDMKAKPPP